MNIFLFDDRNDSFLSGVVHSFVVNVLFLIGLLFVYGLFYFFKIGTLGLIFFTIYALNLNLFSKQLYFLTATYFAKASSYRYKKDIGVLLGSFLITIIIAYISIDKFNLFEISKENYSRLIKVSCATYLIICTIIMKNKTVSGIEFTTEKVKESEKKFFIEKKELKKFEWIWYIFYVCLLGLFLLYLNYHGF
ncbi:hypothetical protein IRT38_00530 (plasmid) [Acinetobacter sp. SK-43]|uniref:hypothetical protein n=1 Tax=Acinetobacter sp. SK-43 TaxID=2785295 RepID=UPI00188B922C|nr:hypothetical protein [Acinetobacter sp. SK-43]MBF4453900.1 hypothetical protein [Acinetobacter sp. SK-43]